MQGRTLFLPFSFRFGLLLKERGYKSEHVITAHDGLSTTRDDLSRRHVKADCRSGFQICPFVALLTLCSASVLPEIAPNCAVRLTLIASTTRNRPSDSSAFQKEIGESASSKCPCTRTLHHAVHHTREGKPTGAFRQQ